MVKEIRNSNGFYSITDNGDVLSHERSVLKSNGGIQIVKEKFLKQNVTIHGYAYVKLQINGKQKHSVIHRLVSEAFIPNPLNLPDINHKDGNKLNNNVDNLEWCNESHNAIHALKNGLNKNIGENCRLSKLTLNDVNDIRNSNLKQSELMKRYCISSAQVSRIKTGKQWKYVI